jgi:hypothetical protein
MLSRAPFGPRVAICASNVVQSGLVDTPTRPAGPALSVARTRAREAETNENCLRVWLEQRPAQGCAMTTTVWCFWRITTALWGPWPFLIHSQLRPPNAYPGIQTRSALCCFCRAVTRPQLPLTTPARCRRECLADPFPTRPLRSAVWAPDRENLVLIAIVQRFALSASPSHLPDCTHIALTSPGSTYVPPFPLKLQTAGIADRPSHDSLNSAVRAARCLTGS